MSAYLSRAVTRGALHSLNNDSVAYAEVVRRTAPSHDLSDPTSVTTAGVLDWGAGSRIGDVQPRELHTSTREHAVTAPIRATAACS